MIVIQILEVVNSVLRTFKVTFNPSSSESRNIGGFDIFVLFVDLILDIAFMGFLSKFY